MIIRDGFVTNSSSTNFLIISKEELSKDYLRKKLGFKDNSRLNSFGNDLINSIIWSINRNQTYYENNISYKEIETLFGQAVAQKSEELRKKGYLVYLGDASSDEDCLTAFMALDHFIINDDDFYMNGENCVW